MSMDDANNDVAKHSLVFHHNIFISAVVLDILVVLSCWDAPMRRWLAIAIAIVWSTLNGVIFPMLSKKMDISIVGKIRENGNALGQILKVLVSYAALPTWGWLIAFSTMTDKEGIVFSRRSMVILLIVQIAASMYWESSWIMVATLSVVTIMATHLSMKRAQVLLDAVAEQRHQRKQVEQATVELKQLQKIATQQEKLSSLGMLAAGVAHEINNPMAFVSSNIYQLVKELPQLAESSELRREYEQEILPETLEGIGRVNTIVGDLRRFARGDVETATQFFIGQEIQSAVRITHGRLAPGVAMDMELTSIPKQTGFPRQISQVLVNLLVNAAHAVESGGRILVRSGLSASEVWFSVSDDGTGIPDDISDKVFDPFFTTKPLGEGTGLGLAVVHGIVTQLNGNVEMESSKETGSIFTVRLPRMDA